MILLICYKFTQFWISPIESLSDFKGGLISFLKQGKGFDTFLTRFNLKIYEILWFYEKFKVLC